MIEAERDATRRAVMAAHPFLEKMPRMVDRLCVEHLASQPGRQWP